MLTQTQKKEVSTTTGRKRDLMIYDRERRKDITKGFLLLRKWVPDIENLNRRDMLIETVDYIKALKNKIKELQNKINEKESPRESTPHTPPDMGRDSVPKITLHYYGTEQESDSTNPEKHSEGSSSRVEKDMDTGLSSYSDISEPEMVDPTPMVATSPTGRSHMDDHSTETVQTTSEEIPESVNPEEEEEELL
jgi:hypothetical protein